MVAPMTHGSRYRFRLADVICPDRPEVVSQITPELEVSGQIVLLSDGGDQPKKFAVLEVEGIAGPLIVPIDCLVPDTAAPDHVDARYERVILGK